MFEPYHVVPSYVVTARRKKRHRDDKNGVPPPLPLAVSSDVSASGDSSPTKRRKMCVVSGCSRSIIGGKSKCTWHQLWSWSCPSQTLADMFSASCSTHPGADACADAVVPSEPEMKILLQKHRRLMDEERVKLGGCAWHRLHKISKVVLDTHRKLINGVIEAMATDICRLEDRDAPSGVEPSVNIASSYALKSLVEKLYRVGLLCRESKLLHVEEPYLLLKVRWFQVSKMGGRSQATVSDVKGFFHHLLDTNDPLTCDLIHFEKSHMLKFMTVANFHK